jgi:hypothetical protein
LYDYHLYVPDEVTQHYDVEKMSKLKLEALIAQASDPRDSVPHIPNGYRAGDPVPYMPGSGEPLIGRAAVEGRYSWVGR